MAVNYSAGRENIGSLYSNLRQAIANKGAAENLQKEREIERKGLFGTGISSSDLKGMSDVGLGIAEFGQGRMDKQMANAEKSYGRRQAASERRIATLKERAKGTGGDVYKNLMKEIEGIEMGMSETRNAFEDKMGQYSGKGIWGTGFGSEEVGWRTSDKGAVGPESIYSKMTGKGGEGGEGGEGEGVTLGSGPKPWEVSDGRGEESGSWDPGVGGSDSGGTALGSGPPPGGGRTRPIRQAGSMGPGEEWSPGAGGSGSGGTALGTGSGPGASGRGGGRGSWDPGAGGRGSGGSTMGSGPGPGASGGGRTEQRTPEAFQMDDIAPRGNKFSEGIMNTGRRSGPVQDNAPFETFKDAFRNARREKGAGAVFDWTNPRTGKRNPYTTDYK